MNFPAIQEFFQNRQAKPEGNYERFSVLVPIVKVKDQLELLFEIRSDHLKVQPKEICFPGGKIEKNESEKMCAIRETCEELNISSDHIKIFGSLDFLVLPYNIILYPFLGSISSIDPKKIQFNKDEVSEVFTVPIDFFMENEPQKHFIYLNAHIPETFPFHMIPSGKNYNWRTGKYPVLFYKYKEYVIWGMTARIIKNFVDIIKSKKSSLR
ncbi:NUDIX hydrolase [Crassaminicella indica]|uniref:CoA pyrophosphatase n=1 Tax=Crassaminicella indica TaxID=2855394 RepID=A0ABX8RF98_9CLOT|nr:CoA pyrophosphatase [Crassaminicella indica]QXM06415.1 CoA pyrophosphatase [Crassaminicella indica]